VCLIIDANVVARLFESPSRPECRRILDWLDGDGMVVHGGRLTLELLAVTRFGRYLAELDRQRKAVRIDGAVLKEEEATLHKMGLCSSDDHHIVALARRSGARTLWTEDADLMDDFKMAALVSKPRGKVYRRATHSRLLCHTLNCPAK
jgi:predicted nucleic acid-binding protein